MWTVERAGRTVCVIDLSVLRCVKERDLLGLDAGLAEPQSQLILSYRKPIKLYIGINNYKDF